MLDINFILNSKRGTEQKIGAGIQRVWYRGPQNKMLPVIEKDTTSDERTSLEQVETLNFAAQLGLGVPEFYLSCLDGRLQGKHELHGQNILLSTDLTNGGQYPLVDLHPRTVGDILQRPGITVHGPKYLSKFSNILDIFWKLSEGLALFAANGIQPRLDYFFAVETQDNPKIGVLYFADVGHARQLATIGKKPPELKFHEKMRYQHEKIITSQFELLYSNLIKS